jgi:pilus assembly protein CpaB
MGRRERAVQAQLGPLTQIVVARKALPAGHAIALADLAVRRLPARYAPPGPPVFAATLQGRRLAVPVEAGVPLDTDLLAQAPTAPVIAKGQRAIEIVATGAPGEITAGAHVDVLVTTDRRAGSAGTARLALEDVEVIAARPAATEQGKAPKVTATLRVTPAQAVYLEAAQSFAADVRLLGRAPGDRRHVGALTVGDGL